MALNDSWKERGLCNGAPDPEVWWPAGPSDVDKIEEAKRICSMCPVRQRCLTYAVEKRQYYGIFGGQTEEERREIRKLTQPHRHRGRFVSRRIDAQESTDVGVDREEVTV